MGFSDRYRASLTGLKVRGNTHNLDFWGIVFGRPVAFSILLLIGDIPWLTPNMLTHASNAFLVAGAAAILVGTWPWFMVAVALLNISYAFDCADGQLARYRKNGSLVGSYYDKMSDHFGMTLIYTALAWVAFQRNPQPLYFLLAIAAISGNLIIGYAKWIAAAHGKLVESTGASEDSGLLRAGLIVLRKGIEFRDADIFLWCSLGLILDHPEIGLVLMGISQFVVAIISSFHRGWLMSRPSPPDSGNH